MNLRRKASDTLDNVSSAATTVIDTSQIATIALVAVAAVAILALGIAVIALNRGF